MTFLASVPIWVTLPSGLVVAATLRMKGVRQWSAPDHTRIVIELDAPGRFETRMYDGPPHRIVIEIPGAEIEGKFPEQPIHDGLIGVIRALTDLPGTLLLEITLLREASYSAFPLAPNAGGQFHRIVLDVRKLFTEAEKQVEERHAESVRESGDVVVAIDAGHGGNDPGCTNPGLELMEKDLALDMAKRLAAAVSALPRVRAVLTRDKDYFVPLAQRPIIAKRFGARLFVSIHANSAASSGARGAEIYFVSLQGAADKAARELVDRENAADLVGGVPPDKEKTPLVDILVNLTQNNAIRRSERLGELMLRRVEQVQGMEVRGLKQGPLAVLKSIASPSVLVELGFITNTRDAKLLSDPARLQQYAQQLAAGIGDYLKSA